MAIYDFKIPCAKFAVIASVAKQSREIQTNFNSQKNLLEFKIHKIFEIFPKFYWIAPLALPSRNDTNYSVW